MKDEVPSVIIMMVHLNRPSGRSGADVPEVEAFYFDWVMDGGEMRRLSIGLFFLLVAGVPALCVAGEFVGRLERVDLETVTLRGDHNKMRVFQVDPGHRQQAAPFLGKWIAVDFSRENDVLRATGFRCPAHR